VHIPKEFRDLFDRPVVAMLATSGAAGQVAVSPIWFELLGDDRVRFSSLAKTLKSRHVHENPRVALCVLDPADAYRFVELRGAVTEVTTDGAHEHLDAMAKRYWEMPAYPDHDYASNRFLMTMRVDHVATSSG
jgi:PPOX class probable F420-dependent enzyme